MKYEDAVDHLCLMRTGGLVDAEVVDAIVDTHAQIANDALVQQLVRDAEQSRDRAYAERNKLVAFLSHIYPAHLADHPEADASWEDDWRNIVIIQTTAGQLSWHIHASELPLFAHLQRKPNDWDGHTTEEKYARLATLGGMGIDR
jgi:hypothetical protein